jgi:prepilin-type N-terminal cleavage/methylation domain-containing protein
MRSRARHGYTLVELLIAVAILGIMGTMVAQLMMSQQRFFQRMTEQTGVRRELRTALGTLPTELRGVSSPGGDISAFGTSSITFRATIGTSFVCEKSSNTSLDVPPVNTARTITSNWVNVPAVGDMVYVLRHENAGVPGDFWSAHQITGVSSNAAFCSSSPFIDPALDAGKARIRFTVTPTLPTEVTTGAALRFTRTARYELASQASGRWYLQRQEQVGGASWTTPVVLSGPYLPPQANGTGGLALTYFDSTGAPIPIGGDRLRIARIDVALRALGQTGSQRNTAAPHDSVRLSIAMRNRR